MESISRNCRGNNCGNVWRGGLAVKYKAIRCDICGNDIDSKGTCYKFKRRDFYPIYSEIGVFKVKKVWTTLDMCETCLEDLKSFVIGNNQLRKDGQQPVVIRDADGE